MSDDQHECDSGSRSELHIAQIVYATTSQGYRLSLAVAVSATYAESILKEKLPNHLHADIETYPLPPLEAASEKHPAFAAWIPVTAREGLAKTGESGGYYFSEYYYDMTPASHGWDRFIDTE